MALVHHILMFMKQSWFIINILGKIRNKLERLITLCMNVRMLSMIKQPDMVFF